MTKIRIKIVTRRESLAPDGVPFYTVTCTGCGHDDSVPAAIPGWPTLHQLFEDAMIRAESMYFDHLTGTGHTNVRVCPMMLFDTQEWDRRIGTFMGEAAYVEDDEEDPRESGWPLVGASVETIQVLARTVNKLLDQKEDS